MPQERKLVHRFWFALKATVLCLLAPESFGRLSVERDGAQALAQNRKTAKNIRRAFLFSLLWTVGAILAGYFFGLELKCFRGAATASTATFFQLVSAAVVLIATLAVRGWEIQTFQGNTLAEKVNQWLPRALFVVGTFFFSLFLGWTG